MANFREQLDGELERRGLKDKSVEENEPQKKKKEKRLKAQIPFSFKAFFTALFLGCLIFLAIFIWLVMNAEKTAQSFVENLPTKTAIVNREVNPIITTEDVQPVLRMSPLETTEIPSAQPPETPEINQKDSNTALGVAQAPGLYKTSKFGPLPIINKENGETSFKTYRKTATFNSDKTSIAFVVTDMGINNSKTKKLISDLPENISFSFSPYAWNIKSLMMAAQQDNHETWVTLPLQTKDYPLQDPGPLAVLNGASVPQNQIRLRTLLGKTIGYPGLIAKKDHIFRREDARTNPVFKEIFERGLAIIDSNDKSINFISQIAEQKGYPYGQNNFWLDEDLRPLALNQKLRQALEQSRNSGKAIVMLRPYPASIKTLKKFLDSVAAQEFNIVPLSTLVKTEE
jgi:hypothetical protein